MIKDNQELQEPKEEMIPILINNSYGGFGLSEEAIELYNKKKSALDPTNVKHEKYFGYTRQRIDPILIEVFHELGDRINEKYSKIECEQIPKKYANYYHIQDYDGKEWFDIEYELYVIDQIQSILNDIFLSSDEKIEKIQLVITNRYKTRR